MLNFIWAGFFIIAFISALFQLIIWGDTQVFVRLMDSVFSMSRLAFEISLGLIGVMAFWLGIMKVGEKSGFLDAIVRFLRPLLKRLFPGVPADHPAMGSMLLNLSSNALGLDNAATPLGLKAMQDLQSLNPDPERATNAQILFLVLNTSSVTLFPVTVFAFRAQQGAENPTDVFIPILFATFASTLTGLLFVGWNQGLKLFDRVVLSYLGGFFLFMAALLLYFVNLNQEAMQSQSAFLSNFLLFSIITGFISGALVKKVNVFEVFIEGAKKGFDVAITIIPYLVAMLVGIGVFRACGVLDGLLDLMRIFVSVMGGDTRFVDALPTAVMKPFSGSGARSLMVETMQAHGADSFAGKLVGIVQGSTETTFYVAALYFGAVKIKNTRNAIPFGLAADFAGIVAAIVLGYLFFG
ncbi:MAG: spore maturation protein [Candidatus Nitronauta litoralis]|uniref:Spore maturation protein n=1 Tax=Candidatus Nitronauta litoralis TaxID=2705533 RepID=A0A7T0BXY2_9BACT|nr:MAG: spore maturation protein [Candidatus Nitronauta litoralis]